MLGLIIVGVLILLGGGIAAAVEGDSDELSAVLGLLFGILLVLGLVVGILVLGIYFGGTS